MFWDLLQIELWIILLGLLGFVFCLLAPLILAYVFKFIGRPFSVKYYCDLWKFYACFLVVWLVGIGLAVWGLHYVFAEQPVPIRELTSTQKKDVLQLSQHEFDEAMKGKSKDKKDRIEREYKNNWFTVEPTPQGKTTLKLTENTTIPRWQKSWVELREKLERKLNRTINADWEKVRPSNKKVLSDKNLKSEAFKWIYYMSKWQLVVVLGCEWLVTLVIVGLLCIKVRRTGGAEDVRKELLGDYADSEQN